MPDSSPATASSPLFGLVFATGEEEVTATLALGRSEPSDAAAAFVGQAAAEYGAARLAGAAASAVESSCRFLRPVPGDVLKATARPLRREAGLQVWRASVHRGFAAFRPDASNQAAEVTQSFLTAAPLPTPAAVDLEPAGGTADQRRRQIFSAACEVISRKGYDKASVREIAAAAGLPIPTLYLYVRNKEDILHMITQGLMEDIFRDFRENLSAEGSATEKLARAIASYLRYIDRNRRYINLVYRETRSLSRENREKIFAIERDFARLWQEILEEGGRSGAFRLREPALTAEFVYFLCTAWAIRHWTLGRFEAAQVREELTRFVLEGLGAETTGRKRDG